MTDKVLFLPGDGVGPSMVSAAKEVLSRTTDAVEIVDGMIGRSAYESTGQYLPHETLGLLDECKTVVSGPVIPQSNGSSTLTTLKIQLDLYAWSRHFRTLAPDLGREMIDIVLWGSSINISNEITEIPDTVGITLNKYVKSQSYSRMIRLAHDNAEKKGLNRVACLIRPDFYPLSSNMFKETFESLFPADVYSIRVMNVKDWAAHIIKEPAHDQCIVCADLYSQVVGGFLGGLTGFDHLNPTFYQGDEYKLYQPISNASIPGTECKDVNPTSFILSVVDILYDMNLKNEADSVLKAVVETYGANERTLDVGGTLTAEEFTEKVLSRI